MKIIGITGGTGCGKTTVLKYLAGLGAKVIDCDALYHEMLNTDMAMLGDIEKRFPGIVENGSLDTKKLGAVVFKDSTGLEDLSRITRTYIREGVRSQILDEKSVGREILGIDAIQLIESGLGDFCHRIIGVIADSDVRLRRIMARDGISAEYAASRIASQKSNEYFIENCDMIIENNGDDMKLFEEECAAMVSELLNGISKEEEL
mgnify:FL=1